ncbi:hypothetical protein JCM33374_g1443 [Metschnikowia sp. JCM 33374]|nr:hypothetical protein JCM33374_g1443 [Metschnikowia sp. JCM 33374]
MHEKSAQDLIISTDPKLQGQAIPSFNTCFRESSIARIFRTPGTISMDLAFLRDKGFRVYTANQYPSLSVPHKAFIESLVAQYFYTKYTNSTSDLIPRFKSAQDVHVSVTTETLSLQDLRLLHLSVVHGSSTQTVVFVAHNDTYLALIRSPSPVFLAEVLESLSLDRPLSLRPLKLTHEFITGYVNGLGALLDPSGEGSDGTGEEPSTVGFGPVAMSFVPRKPLTGASLKEICVEFPKEDTSRILRKGTPPLDCLYEWLKRTTTLQFQNIDLATFSCGLFTFRANMVTISCPLEPENVPVVIIRTLLERVSSLF